MDYMGNDTDGEDTNGDEYGEARDKIDNNWTAGPNTIQVEQSDSANEIQETATEKTAEVTITEQASKANDNTAVPRGKGGTWVLRVTVCAAPSVTLNICKGIYFINTICKGVFFNGQRCNFGTSGENNENVLVIICKGTVSWKKKYVRVYFHAILRFQFWDLEPGPHPPVNIK